MNENNDVLSETLKLMQITGSLLLNENYSAPWAVSIPDRLELINDMGGNKDIHIVAFHLVRRGYIEIKLENGYKEIVHKGEMVICFSGVAHTLFQGSSQIVCPFKKIMQEGQNIFEPTKEGYAQSTSLLCGIFMLRNTILNPLFEALPPLLKINTGQGDYNSYSTTANIIKLLLKEIDQRSFAHSYIMERYLELLCAHSIQLHIEKPPVNETGWLYAIKDPMTAQVITAIHARPDYAWSVKELSKLVSLSPSRFAARFADIMQTSPMLYVARWRMYLASKLLKETKLSIEQVSSRIGYENVAAFSRAFKRNLDTSPGVWRRNNCF